MANLWDSCKDVKEMLVNILLGIMIFGYATWTLFRYIKKSKQGQCATCALKETCKNPCDSVTHQKLQTNKNKKH